MIKKSAAKLADKNLRQPEEWALASILGDLDSASILILWASMISDVHEATLYEK